MKKWIPAITLLIILLFGGRVNAEGKKYEVHFLDIGQSDCILIKGEDKNYLIDTGLPRTADQVLDYLNKQHISKIDDIIITHYHDDHYGGLEKIIKNKTVSRIILPRHQRKYRELIFSYLQNKNVKVEYISPDYFIKGNNIDLKVLVPNNEDRVIENNNGIVLFGIIEGLKYAFMADVEKEREKELLNYKDIFNCDIVKAAHHGLDTSSTEELVKAVDAKIVVITCDGSESPNDVVIDRFSNNKAAILRTDKHGNIIVKRGAQDKSVEILMNKMVK